MVIKKVVKKTPIAGTDKDLRKRKVKRTPRSSTISPEKCQGAVSRKQVIRDRMAGLSLHAIADKNGISHNLAYTIIKNFLENVMSPETDMEMAKRIWIRYEMLVESNMPIALQGGKRGKDAALVVMEATAGVRKLFALDKEKTKQVEVSGQIAILSPEDSEL